MFLWGRNQKEREQRIRRDRATTIEALEKEVFLLRNKLAHVQGSLNHMKSLYEQSKEQRDKLQKVTDDYLETIQRIISSLAAIEIAKLKRDNPVQAGNMSTDELVNLTIDAVRTRERSLRQRIVELEEELGKANELIERLKEQLHALQKERLRDVSLLLAKGEDDSDEVGSATSSSDDELVSHESERTSGGSSGVQSFSRRRTSSPSPVYDLDSEESAPPTPTAERRRVSRNVGSDSGVAKAPAQQKPKGNLYVEDLSNLADSISEEHQVLLEIIGKTGIFRTTELKQHPLFLQAFNPTSNYFQQKLQDLLTLGLISQERVNVGARGHTYDVFQLTPKGIKVFEALFNQTPIDSQLKELLARHSTLEHALLVLDTKIVFEKAGYIVDDTHEGNTVKTKSGAIIHFDLTVKKSREAAGIVQRIECERGKQPDNDFFNKLEKWLEVDNNFYFVSPNKEMREAVKRKFFRWAARHTRAKLAEHNLVVRFATLEGLKRNESWEEVRFESLNTVAGG